MRLKRSDPEDNKRDASYGRNQKNRNFTTDPSRHLVHCGGSGIYLNVYLQSPDESDCVTARFGKQRQQIPHMARKQYSNQPGLTEYNSGGRLPLPT
jgi:hypothetical protein